MPGGTQAERKNEADYRRKERIRPAARVAPQRDARL